ncbi:hypothetical protein EWM64_g7614 [Hericium alpestre]|uniref:Uncharacterized protein n=1 Tax=Hericium alpestre TaxID=135208 RepID=A0A4Y9ZQQ6_9AGAM|nr:hypothetical protein EWM64_g7614 [Hericium alpestre]
MAATNSNKYYCDCQQYCKGILKECSRRTYDNHAAYRTPLTMPFDQFQLAMHSQSSSLSVPAGSSSVLSAREHVLEQDSTTSRKHSLGPNADEDAQASAKQPRLHGDTPSDDIEIFDDHDIEDTHLATETWQIESTIPEDHAPSPLDHTIASASPPSHLQLSHSPSPSLPLPPAGAQQSVEDEPPFEDDGHHELEDAPDPGCLSEVDEEFSNEPSEPTVSTRVSLLHEDVCEPMADAALSQIDDIRITQHFIEAMRNASLEHDNLPPDVICRLSDKPLSHPPIINDPDIMLSIKTYLATTSGSQEIYNEVQASIAEYPHNPPIQLLSHDMIKKTVTELSGMTSIVHHIDRETCPMCGEHRYDQAKLHVSKNKVKIPWQEFHTIPLGPQLQAHRRMPEMAEKMQYCSKCMQEIIAELEANHRIDVYDDLCHGTDLLNAVKQGNITDNDTILLFSIDGAQLYQNKASDCWMYIWILLDLAPDVHYKKAHILPGGFIPSPTKPKNLDSFLFPGFYHLAALQNDGLKVWDAAKKKICVDHPFLAFATADTPAMAMLDVEGCDHPDVILQNFTETSQQIATRYETNLLEVMATSNPAQYKKKCLKTGICKPSIYLGFLVSHCLLIPACFPGDLMHLAALNLTDLLLGLWRGTIDCDLKDSRTTWDWMVLHGDTWTTHGKMVADATPYLPGSFD